MYVRVRCQCTRLQFCLVVFRGIGTTALRLISLSVDNALTMRA